MNAKEAMQAMLEGETVYCWSYGEIHKFRLSDDGVLLSWRDTPGRWEPTPWLLNSIEGVYEEYPLTFEQALREMLDGKVVMCNEPFPKYACRFHNGRFEDSHVGDFFTKWEQCGMPSYRQKAKWKVVG